MSKCLKNQDSLIGRAVIQLIFLLLFIPKLYAQPAIYKTTHPQISSLLENIFTELKLKSSLYQISLAFHFKGDPHHFSPGPKEIKELIQDSVVKVEEGMTLANQSGETLEEILIAVKKVNDIIAEIAIANKEQSAGIRHINQSMTIIDKMTQQNATLVEEVATASKSMSSEAQNLKKQVTFFNLGEPEEEQNVKTKPPINSAPTTQFTSPAQTDEGWEEF